MPVVEVEIPEELLRKLDKKIEEGKYESRSQAVRIALQKLLAGNPYIAELPYEEVPTEKYEDLKRIVEKYGVDGRKFILAIFLKSFFVPPGTPFIELVEKTLDFIEVPEDVKRRILEEVKKDPVLSTWVTEEVRKAYEERAEFYGRTLSQEAREVLYGWREPWVYDGRKAEENIQRYMEEIERGEEADWEKRLKEAMKPEEAEWEKRLKKYLGEIGE